MKKRYSTLATQEDEGSSNGEGRSIPSKLSLPRESPRRKQTWKPARKLALLVDESRATGEGKKQKRERKRLIVPQIGKERKRNQKALIQRSFLGKRSD